MWGAGLIGVQGRGVACCAKAGWSVAVAATLGEGWCKIRGSGFRVTVRVVGGPVAELPLHAACKGCRLTAGRAVQGASQPAAQQLHVPCWGRPQHHRLPHAQTGVRWGHGAAPVLTLGAGRCRTRMPRRWC